MQQATFLFLLLAIAFSQGGVLIRNNKQTENDQVALGSENPWQPTERWYSRLTVVPEHYGREKWSEAKFPIYISFSKKEWDRIRSKLGSPTILPITPWETKEREAYLLVRKDSPNLGLLIQVGPKQRFVRIWMNAFGVPPRIREAEIAVAQWLTQLARAAGKSD